MPTPPGMTRHAPGGVNPYQSHSLGTHANREACPPNACGPQQDGASESRLPGRWEGTPTRQGGKRRGRDATQYL